MNTKMLYRPATDQHGINGLNILKTTYQGASLDAVIVPTSEDEDLLSEYTEKGWFANPDDMFAEKPKASRSKKAQA